MRKSVTIRIGADTQERLKAYGTLGDTFDTLINKALDALAREERKADRDADMRECEREKSAYEDEMRSRSDDELRARLDNANARIEEMRSREGKYHGARFHDPLRAWENLTADELVWISVSLSLTVKEAVVLDVLINKKYAEDELRRRNTETPANDKR